MARKNIITSFKMLDGVNLSADRTSSLTKVSHLDRASVSVEWSGSDAVGVIEFEQRKIKDSTSTADSDWKTVDFGAVINITGGSGSHEIIFDALDFTDLRVKFVYTSGTTGSLTATLTAKQIGG